MKFSSKKMSNSFNGTHDKNMGNDSNKNMGGNILDHDMKKSKVATKFHKFRTILELQIHIFYFFNSYEQLLNYCIAIGFPLFKYECFKDFEHSEVADFSSMANNVEQIAVNADNVGQGTAKVDNCSRWKREGMHEIRGRHIDSHSTDIDRNNNDILKLHKNVVDSTCKLTKHALKMPHHFKHAIIEETILVDLLQKLYHSQFLSRQGCYSPASDCDFTYKAHNLSSREYESYQHSQNLEKRNSDFDNDKSLTNQDFRNSQFLQSSLYWHKELHMYSQWDRSQSSPRFVTCISEPASNFILRRDKLVTIYKNQISLLSIHWERKYIRPSKNELTDTLHSKEKLSEVESSPDFLQISLKDSSQYKKEEFGSSSKLQQNGTVSQSISNNGNIPTFFKSIIPHFKNVKRHRVKMHHGVNLSYSTNILGLSFAMTEYLLGVRWRSLVRDTTYLYIFSSSSLDLLRVFQAQVCNAFIFTSDINLVVHMNNALQLYQINTNSFQIQFQCEWFTRSDIISLMIPQRYEEALLHNKYLYGETHLSSPIILCLYWKEIVFWDIRTNVPLHKGVIDISKKNFHIDDPKNLPSVSFGEEYLVIIGTQSVDSVIEIYKLDFETSIHVCIRKIHIGRHRFQHYDFPLIRTISSTDKPQHYKDLLFYESSTHLLNVIDLHTVELKLIESFEQPISSFVNETQFFVPLPSALQGCRCGTIVKWNQRKHYMLLYNLKDPNATQVLELESRINCIDAVDDLIFLQKEDKIYVYTYT